MSNNEYAELLHELKKITKILTLTNSEKLQEEIGRFATTDERKKIWVLLDGTRQPKDIAQQLKLTPRGVNKFLRVLESADLIERGEAPRRLTDFVPANWVEMLTDEEPSELKTTLDNGLKADSEGSENG